MKIILGAAGLAALLAVPSFAQNSSVEVTITGEVRGSVGLSSAGEPDVATLVDGVTAIAQGLQNRVATLSRQMEASSDTESGTRALDEMLAAARELQDSLGRDSELWDEMNGMMDLWGTRRDELLERAKVNPALRPIATGWQKRIDEGLKLREQILIQAAESEALIDQIESQREVIVEYYNLGLADQALQTMRVMSDELGTMNASMTSILAQANVVAEPPSVDQ